MEEMHRTHKETAWGWAALVDDWRRGRTRQRLRRSRGKTSSWNSRVLPDWTL